MAAKFQLGSPYASACDQTKAIEQLIGGFRSGRGAFRNSLGESDGEAMRSPGRQYSPRPAPRLRR